MLDMAAPMRQSAGGAMGRPHRPSHRPVLQTGIAVGQRAVTCWSGHASGRGRFLHARLGSRLDRCGIRWDNRLHRDGR